MSYQFSEIFNILMPILFTSMLSISSIDSLEFIIPAIKLMENSNNLEDMRDSALALVLEFGEKNNVSKKHEACQISFCQVLENIWLLSNATLKNKDFEDQTSKWIASFIESPKLVTYFL